jgi:DNA-binding beta-propeller fold protein YncE
MKNLSTRLSILAISISIIITACTKPQVAPAPSIVGSSSPITAGFGDTITIKGNNLLAATGYTIIKLNGQIFSIVASSNTYVEAVVPKFVGSGQITVDVNGKIYNGPMFTYKYKAIVTTLAGSGTAGNSDGQGIAASFNQPWGLAVDTSGNVYVADESNRAIRQITPTGTVSTIAIPNTINGGNFYSPYDIAINTATHTLFVTDFNTDVLQIGSNNSMTVIYTGAAPLSGIGVSPNNLLYVANNTTGSIVQLTPGSQTVTPFTTVAAPRNIVFDKAGNMYVAGLDQSNNEAAIFKVTSSGAASVLYDDPGFKGDEIATDQYGNFFEADYFGNTIRMIDKSGNIFTLAGSGTAADVDGQGLNASFSGPRGIAIDSKGNLYVSTYNSTSGGNKIRKIVVQ